MMNRMLSGLCVCCHSYALSGRSTGGVVSLHVRSHSAGAGAVATCGAPLPSHCVRFGSSECSMVTEHALGALLPVSARPIVHGALPMHAPCSLARFGLIMPQFAGAGVLGGQQLQIAEPGVSGAHRQPGAIVWLLICAESDPSVTLLCPCAGPTVRFWCCS